MEGGKIESYQGLMDIKRVQRDTTTIDRGFERKLSETGMGILNHMVQILNTDAAKEATERIAHRIADLRGAFDFRDIQEILALLVRKEFKA